MSVFLVPQIVHIISVYIKKKFIFIIYVVYETIKNRMRNDYVEFQINPILEQKNASTSTVIANSNRVCR
jgi:hypothetical protein